MSKTKFTKGPWIIKNNFQVGCEVDFGDGFFTLADCQIFNDGRANAHLIAAAPEMYEALEELYRTFEMGEALESKVERLLAKARGEQ